MTLMNLLLLILIGGIAGWLAGEIKRGHGFGLVGNIVVGICGSFFGHFLLGLLGIYAGGILGNLIAATLGAIALLALIGLIKRA